jgi:hypothetical protein
MALRLEMILIYWSWLKRLYRKEHMYVLFLMLSATRCRSQGRFLANSLSLLDSLKSLRFGGDGEKSTSGFSINGLRVQGPVY